MIQLTQILPKLQAQRDEMLVALADPTKATAFAKRWGCTPEKMKDNLSAIAAQIEEANKINRARR